MWLYITNFIIRQRVVMILLVLGITIFMGYKAKDIKLSYELAQIIPDDDEEIVAYNKFKTEFGDDGNVFVIGIQSKQLWQIEFFREWWFLSDTIKGIAGVDKVFSLPEILYLKKDQDQGKFVVERLFKQVPATQKELDSLRKEFDRLPFYKDVVVNENTLATFLAISINQKVLASKDRERVLDEAMKQVEILMQGFRVQIHYSGLPYIRTKVASLVQKELKFFSVLSLLACALILLYFFRSFGAVFFPIIVITIIVIWSLGTVVLFGYKINVITGLIPPLIIIIGVPNFIYFINKYHNEYVKYGNKLNAIQRMVEKIGIVTFMTNATTAIGFLVLAFANSPVLKEFGIVAGINIVATFFVSLILIPVLFSYLPEPSQKHTYYLDRRGMNSILAWINHVVQKRRRIVFGLTGLLILVSIYGVTKLQTLGFIADDIPHNNVIYTDLQFFEKNFTGVMPFEIIINTKKPNGATDLGVMKKVSHFQDSIQSIGILSKSLSIVDLVKFSRQAYYNGNEQRYGLPSTRERSFLLPYLTNSNGNSSIANNLVDSEQQVLRITATMADVGTIEVKKMMDEMNGIAKSIFGEDITYSFTGVSLLFLKNNEYLIKSLIYSMILAFVLISILLGLLFKRLRMIIISLLPNIIPLLMTAGMMGYFGIPLKPSTVLVFSIAFGISIDDALHFLAKYRQELLHHNWDIPKTISVALLETGRSMIYTSIVLFFGFSIFILSDFGGTQALGLLTSTTLLVAMLTNIILLPSLILSFYPSRKV